MLKFLDCCTISSVINKHIFTKSDKVLLMVEGITDEYVFSKFIDENVCKICASGVIITKEKSAEEKVNDIQISKQKNELTIKDEIIKKIEKYEKAYQSMYGAGNCPKVIAILDKDYDKYIIKYESKPYVFYTDSHDLETMIYSDALYVDNEKFKNIILQFCNEEAIVDIDDTIKKIVELARKIGILRLVGAKLSSLEDRIFGEIVNLNFKGMDFDEYIDWDKLELKEEQLIEELARLFIDTKKDVKFKYSINDIKQELLKLYDENYKLYKSERNMDICNGHDISRIIAGFINENGRLKIFYGKKNRNYKINRKDLEIIIRMNYNIEEFRLTELCESLVRWGSNNNMTIIKL